jgi:hypothetical protein
MSQSEVEKTEQSYPAVGLAYEVALASYEVAQKRYDAIDARIQTLLAFATTLTLAVPAAASSIRGADLRSRWLISALIAFAGTVAVGTYARWKGDIILLNPKHLYDGWLRYSEWEFKTNMVYWAGEHFEANRRLINSKGRLAVAASIMFALEALMLVVWVLLARV